MQGEYKYGTVMDQKYLYFLRALEPNLAQVSSSWEVGRPQWTGRSSEAFLLSDLNDHAGTWKRNDWDIEKDKKIKYF